ncbi:glycine--tRNA ligase [Algisphaera agarilytica]|uniref:Glycine--tRNA ligase n=1 Tax=Algisphaera agarilytica TaxID=1385975 RepID=A0A7X0H5B2_9BACT|nr:glycine--tRNA ligase [Algisphaera agarilytica]MBB6429322.1 glycyl-tRNA synthetase [Algisphaera agarilytica]
MSETQAPLDPASKSMDELVALCKRRGFVYPASEIYGGLNGFWDYGPLGTALKNNIRDHWWKHMVECPPIGPDGNPVSIVGLDSSIIQNPKTWEASGHVGGFSDPMVDCTETKKRYRADQVEVLIVEGKGKWAFMENQPDTIAKKLKKAGVALDDGERKLLTDLDLSEYATIVAPDTDKPGTLTEPREFNLMFDTTVGAIKSEDNKAYLRPETAQGIFLNYKNVVDTMRVKMPFGIAQIGKSFRNEVTPRNFIFRSREFEQMEMEWFCAPDEALQWYDFWKHERMRWWKTLGIEESNLIFRDHDDDELAHYSNACVDVEYKYPFTAPGYGELEGVAHRGCFDLTQHQTHSKTKMEYFDQPRQLAAKEEGKSKEEINEVSKYIPNVIEPASGLTRAVLVLLCEAFTPDESRASKVYMKFKPKFAPVKAGIFPLVNKDGMPEKALSLYMELREKFTCEYDAKQSIGKRYARMDEIGTPFCFTVDGDTATDDSVTVRHRDTQEQERVNISQVESFLAEKLAD